MAIGELYISNCVNGRCLYINPLFILKKTRGNFGEISAHCENRVHICHKWGPVQI